MKRIYPVLLCVVLLAGCREKTQLEKDFDWAYSNARSEDERRLLQFGYRCAYAKGEAEYQKIKIPDGVDQFEAYLIASAYRGSLYGLCGAVGLPKLEERRWVVSVGVGPSAEARPPIFIDSVTGKIEHLGYADIEDTAAWLKKPSPPNQTAETTAVECPPSNHGSRPAVSHL